ncbi:MULTISPECIES: hypothetical protein [Streptomyces]|uniref:hypothetical protein n=1 Tax=Streptomyces TaxID=1883 RepID=UPI001239C42E|nr:MULTISPECIES: hypothetical protein [Streptomyces]NEA00235.1 hypothetical protein [Streptomyces sp. SID10116]MYY84546.1 hypothetical protein [Streptomyces sp. SID335]MYZ16389.1 hypothetical protein [Streptomyces sp. SID337]NDZ84308.1 hypothetical protein [Streptomyces sp. SID10115]NEB42803.1 hypothetical protein [Streptomyces sp. SID339]
MPTSLARVLPGHGPARHARARRRRGRLHRRLLAYRDVRIVHSPGPAARTDTLLLVHTRRVVGQLTYEVCEQCASGVITDVYVASPLQDSGLGTRAISHLRACYPDVAWRSRLTKRMTRDLAHRMRLPHTEATRTCGHSTSGRAPAAGPDRVTPSRHGAPSRAPEACG